MKLTNEQPHPIDYGSLELGCRVLAWAIIFFVVGVCSLAQDSLSEFSSTRAQYLAAAMISSFIAVSYSETRFKRIVFIDFAVLLLFGIPTVTYYVVSAIPNPPEWLVFLFKGPDAEWFMLELLTPLILMAMTAAAIGWIVRFGARLGPEFEWTRTGAIVVMGITVLIAAIVRLVFQFSVDLVPPQTPSDFIQAIRIELPPLLPILFVSFPVICSKSFLQVVQKAAAMAFGVAMTYLFAATIWPLESHSIFPKYWRALEGIAIGTSMGWILCKVVSVQVWAAIDPKPVLAEVVEVDGKSTESGQTESDSVPKHG